MVLRDSAHDTDLPAVQGRRWIRALERDRLVDDEGVRVPTRPPIALFATRDGVFCIDDTCTHETFSLAEGWVDDCTVECALHMARFDLRTGAVMSPPACRPVAVHPVALVGGVVHVAIPDDYVHEQEAADGLA